MLQVWEHFDQGVSHGLRTKWSPAGRKLSEATIERGKITGTSRRWHDNGQVAEDVEMKDGEPHGLALAYYPDGSIKSQAHRIGAGDRAVRVGGRRTTRTGRLAGESPSAARRMNGRPPASLPALVTARRFAASGRRINCLYGARRRALPDAFAYRIIDATGLSAEGRVFIVPREPVENVVELRRVADEFSMMFLGVPGEVYRLQFRTSLAPVDSWRDFPEGAPLRERADDSTGVF